MPWKGAFYVVEHRGDENAVLVVDETGFLKKGIKTAGVKRQYSVTAGRIENCQIGVFVAYASTKGHTLLDREFYLPKEWATDADRRKEAGIPQEVKFATKPQLAREMLERAFEAEVLCKWVTADAIYGGDLRLRMWLEAQEQSFVLAVTSAEPLWCNIGRGVRQERATAMAASIADDEWQRLSAGMRGMERKGQDCTTGCEYRLNGWCGSMKKSHNGSIGYWPDEALRSRKN